MLKLLPSVIVHDVPGPFKDRTNNFILFPDDQDPNRFYALAEFPTFLDNKGVPAFNLLWYFGGGQESGGICTMTVALPTPDIDRPEVRDKVLQALNRDASTQAIARLTLDLCRAVEANDAVQVASLKKELGFDDAAVDRVMKRWNKAGEASQFLPQRDGLQISPIDCTSGQVVVKAFSGKKNYQDGKADYSEGFVTTPSRFNSNAAVVTFNLSKTGVNLFWHALGGPSFNASDKKPEGYDTAASSSIVSVVYTIQFQALLPEAKATVTLDHSVVAKLNVDTEEGRGAWGRTYRKEVVRGKEYEDAIQSATQVVVPSSLGDSGRTSVQQLLTDWAAQQLTAMTAAQLPGIKLDDLSLDSARQLKTVQKQSRTYTLTQGVDVPKSPQGQLPQLNTIVDGKTLQSLFRTIDLNDQPYFNVDLTVRPPTLPMMKERQIDRFVLTQLSYANEKLLDGQGSEVNTIEYASTDAPDTPRPSLTGTFDRQKRERVLQYSYLVTYQDGTPSLRVSDRTLKNDNYLDLGAVDLGVLTVRLDGIDLPWGVIEGARVQLQYGDWQRTIVLDRSSETSPQVFSKPFGQMLDQPLSYQLTLNMVGGTVVVGERQSVPLRAGVAEVTLKSPLGSATQEISFELIDGVQKAMLRVEYVLRAAGGDRVFPQLVQLDASEHGGRWSWKVPGGSVPATLRVQKARITTAAGSKDLSGPEVFDPLDQNPNIIVSADGVSSF